MLRTRSLSRAEERLLSPAMRITATVENDTIKLPPGVHVPDGTKARIVFEPAAGRSLAERYAGLIGITDQWPGDMAENHDHYLHAGSSSGLVRA